MPTPRVSRNASQHSPALSSTNANASEVRDPIDWNANVVNFISSCRHPGLVRRTSLAAQHGPVLSGPIGPIYPFRPRHRRNLSAATTVGRFPDTPRASSKPSYALFFPHHPQSNNYNTYQRTGQGYATRSGFGHTRNISDPTACWECFHPDSRPPHIPDYPIFPFPQRVSRQLSSTSPEGIDEFPVIGDARDQVSSYQPPWRKSGMWDGLDESEGVYDDTVGDKIAEIVEEEGEDEEQRVEVPLEISSTLSEERCLLPCLQSCANPVTILLGLSFIMFVQTMVVSGLISSMLTTLERRFNFSTRQVGYMISCYEGSGVLTTVAISFINGQKHNRLRVVGLSTLLLALGFGLFALPHFLFGPYNPDLAVVVSSVSAASPINGSILPESISSTTELVPAINMLVDSLQTPNGHAQSDPIQSLALSIFCVAMVLSGVGASPLHVLAPTYLWDNLSDKQYPLYSALLYSAGGLGPACGFLAGAGFLSVYIDSPLILPRTGLNRNDPLWLGAWWLGMLVCASVTLVAALPVIAFPKQLRNSSLTATGTVNTNGNQNGTKLPDALDFTTDFAHDQLSVVRHLDSPKSTQLLQTRWNTLSHSNLYERQTRLPFTHRRTKSNQIGYHNSTTDGTNHLGFSGSPITTGTAGSPRQQTRATSESILSASWRPRTSVRKASGSLGPRSSLTLSPRRKVTDPVTVEFEGIPLNTLRSRLRERLKAFVLVLRRVLANPIWFGVTFTSVVEHSIVAAFLAFAAKYIQDLFQVPAYIASIHTGAVVVPGSLIGVLSGALMMRHYRPPIDRSLAGISILIGATVLTTISLMLISCPENRVAGLTSTYGGEPWPWLYGPARLADPNLTAECNARCPSSLLTSTHSPPSSSVHRSRVESNLMPPCSPMQFNPVCWRSDSLNDGEVDSSIPRSLTFFNPCYAGCQFRRVSNISRLSTVEEFTNCTCVTQSSLNPSGQPVYNSSGHRVAFGHVTAGRCQTDCPQYTAFLAVLFLHILLTGMLQNPSNVITLSCVSPEDSSVALGLQLFFLRTLAYIPSPIYFGQLFDLICQYRLVANEDSKSRSSISNPGRYTGTNFSYSSNTTAVTTAASRAVFPSNVLSTTEVNDNTATVGACLQYNLEGLPVVWLGVILALKIISLVGSTLTWRVARQQTLKRVRTAANCSSADSGSPHPKRPELFSCRSPASTLHEPVVDTTHTSVLDAAEVSRSVTDPKA